MYAISAPTFNVFYIFFWLDCTDTVKVGFASLTKRGQWPVISKNAEEKVSVPNEISTALYRYHELVHRLRITRKSFAESAHTASQ